MRGGARTIVEPHDRFKGVFILRGKDDALVTKNLTIGESVYNEKRVSVDVSDHIGLFRVIDQGNWRKD